MELVLFTEYGGELNGLHLQNLMARLPHVADVELYRTMAGLASRLRHPAVQTPIVILLAASRQELENLLALRHLLGKAKVFLVIPDAEEETIALAHRLRPRYLGYFGDDFTELASVLGNMAKEGRDGPTAPASPGPLDS